jgi:hydrogenase maturation factor
MNIFGDRLLVERVLEKKTAMDSKGEFKGVVIVLGIGEDFKQGSKRQVKVGDSLLVTGDFLVNGESYVIDKQILRWI